MQQTDLSTSFHPKAYLHLALIVMASLLLLPVRGLIVPHLSANEVSIVNWVLGGVLGITALSVFITLRKNWMTYALEPDAIVIRHRILADRRIPLQVVHSARMVEIPGGRGYKYQSIELQLQSGNFTILDGLYSRGIKEFYGALASKLR